jgi:leader peptidase (prepilin peptidase)/N-methyltransferase
LTLGWIDQRFLILPDILTLPLMLAGIAVTAIMSSGGLLDHLVGAAAGYLTLTLIAWLYRQWRGRDGLGQGDAKLFSALGAWVSWQGLPTVMLYATAVGIIVVSALSIRGASISPDRKLPFGTFLCVGGWLVWLYGPLLLN